MWRTENWIVVCAGSISQVAEKAGYAVKPISTAASGASMRARIIREASSRAWIRGG